MWVSSDKNGHEIVGGQKRNHTAGTPVLDF